MRKCCLEMIRNFFPSFSRCHTKHPSTKNWENALSLGTYINKVSSNYWMEFRKRQQLEHLLEKHFNSSELPDYIRRLTRFSIRYSTDKFHLFQFIREFLVTFSPFDLFFAFLSSVENCRANTFDYCWAHITCVYDNSIFRLVFSFSFDIKVTLSVLLLLNLSCNPMKTCAFDRMHSLFIADELAQRGQNVTSCVKRTACKHIRPIPHTTCQFQCCQFKVKWMESGEKWKTGKNIERILQRIVYAHE